MKMNLAPPFLPSSSPLGSPSMPRFCQAECWPTSVRRTAGGKTRPEARPRVMQMPPPLPPPPLLFRGSVGGQLSEERNVIHLECVLSPPLQRARHGCATTACIQDAGPEMQPISPLAGGWTHISAWKQMEMSAFHMTLIELLTFLKRSGCPQRIMIWFILV